MEHMGISLEKFFSDKHYIQADLKIMIAFDMGTQILNALQILHNGGYVHCDLKPDNICVKETIDPQSKAKKYIFSLIDFGLMRKVKLNKILKD